MGVEERLRALATTAASLGSQRTAPDLLRAAVDGALSVLAADRATAITLADDGTPLVVESGARGPMTITLATPLHDSEGRTIGTFRIGRAGGPGFTDSDGEVLHYFAHIVTASLDNVRLHHEVTDRRRETDELTRVARALTAKLDARAVAQQIVERVAPLFGVRAAILRQLNGDGSLVTIASSGPAERYFEAGQIVAAGMGAAGRAVREGRAIVIRDLQSDPVTATDADAVERNTAAGLHGALAVPLWVEGRIIGVLVVADEAVREFAPEEVALLQAFADQAALALESVRLYEEATRTRDFLRSITASSTDAIVTSDPRGRVAYVSPGAEAMFGYAAEEVLGRSIASFCEGGSAEARQVMARLRRHGQIKNHEMRVRARDGRLIDVIVGLSLLRDPDGTLTGTLGVMKDVTERRLTEQALRESEARHRRIVETADEGVWTLDAEGHTDYVNRRMADMLGYRVDEMIGRSLYDFVDEAARADATLYLARRRAGIRERYDFRFRRRDGSDLWAVVSATPVLDAAGHFRGTLGMIVDITERKRAEDALAERTRRLEAIRAVTAEITRELDLTVLLDVISQRAMDLVRGTSVTLFLLKQERNLLVPAATFGLPASARHHPLAVGRGVAGVVAERREGMIVDDYSASAHHVSWFLEHTEIVACVAQPLLYRGRLLGVIIVNHQAQARFDADDLTLLGLFADQAAIAIENSHLFTREQQARDEAERSSARYRSLVQDLDAIVWEADAETGALTFVSRRAETLLGYPLQDWIGEGAVWLRRVHPEDRERLVALHRRAARGGDAHTLEYRTTRADGQIVWLRERFHRVEGDGGRAQLRGVTMDITETRRAAHALSIRATQQAVVTDLGQRALAGGTLAAVMDAAATAVAVTLRVPCAGVFERRPHQPTLLLRAGVGWRDGVVGGATVEVEANETIDERCALLREHGIVSALTVVMRDPAGVLGLLGVYSTTPRQFTDDEATFLGAVANVLGLAIGRIRADETLRRYNQQLAVLRDIDQAILAAQSAEAIAQEAIHRLRLLVPCLRASVTEFDLDTDETTVLALDSESEAKVSPDRRGPVDPWWKTDDLRQGKVQILEDIEAGDAPSPAMRALFGDGVHVVVSVPLMAEGELIGTLNLGIERHESLAGDHLEVTRQVARSLALAIQQTRLHERVRAGHERLTVLSRRLVEVQEGERRHIARELHDQIGQMLTALKLRLDLPGDASAPEVRASLAQAGQLVNEVMTSVRELSLDLRPTMLDDLGLVAALLWHFDRYTEQTKVQVLFQHAGLEQRRFPPDVETAAYRLVQEALTNVARHAGVDEVTVRLWTEERALAVQVEDRGVGFDARAVPPAGRTGLTGMRERVVLLKGQLSIEASPGEGVRLTAELPLDGGA